MAGCLSDMVDENLVAVLHNLLPTGGVMMDHAQCRGIFAQMF